MGDFTECEDEKLTWPLQQMSCMKATEDRTMATALTKLEDMICKEGAQLPIRPSVSVISSEDLHLLRSLYNQPPMRKGVIMERRIKTFNTKDEAEEYLAQLHSTFTKAPPFCPITRTGCQMRCAAFRFGVAFEAPTGSSWLAVSPHCASPLVSGELLMEETR